MPEVHGRAKGLLLLAPILFFAHVLEEEPRYLTWFNHIAKPEIYSTAFLPGQIPQLIIAALLAGLAVKISKSWAYLLMLLWATHFFFANALYHIVASMATGSYSPGLITAVILYLPYFAGLVWYLRGQLWEPWALALTIGLAGMPSYLQTYMVSFKGTRFF
jgi:Protein of unknown function with HXXEE motif